MKRGKACIGQMVTNKQGVKAEVIDMYTKNDTKCLVTLLFENGLTLTREKYWVNKGGFSSPIMFEVKEYLQKGYKIIKQYPNYIINAYGEIYHIGKGHYFGNHKKHYTDKVYGYVTVTISNKILSVHKLVAETFIRKTKPREEVNHIDGDKQNNKLCNLEIITKKENNKKYFSLKSYNISKKEQIIMETYCMENNINIRQFISNSLKQYINNL